jgi:hypothetical protein
MINAFTFLPTVRIRLSYCRRLFDIAETSSRSWVVHETKNPISSSNSFYDPTFRQEDVSLEDLILDLIGLVHSTGGQSCSVEDLIPVVTFDASWPLGFVDGSRSIRRKRFLAFDSLDADGFEVTRFLPELPLFLEAFDDFGRLLAFRPRTAAEFDLAFVDLDEALNLFSLSVSSSSALINFVETVGLDAAEALWVLCERRETAAIAERLSRRSRL